MTVSICFNSRPRNVTASTDLNELILDDDSNLDVYSRRIVSVHSKGLLGGTYNAEVIDRIFSEDDILASLTAGRRIGSIRTHSVVHDRDGDLLGLVSTPLLVSLRLEGLLGLNALNAVDHVLLMRIDTDGDGQ